MRQLEHLAQHRLLLLREAPDVGTVLGTAQHRGEGDEQHLAEIVPGVLVARVEMAEYSQDRFHRELPNIGVLPRIHDSQLCKSSNPRSAVLSGEQGTVHWDGH